MAKNMLLNAALSKAMALCAEREWCYSDMRQKITLWGIKENDTEKILNNLTDGKFIDEERYAVAFANDRFRHNKWGRIKISSALKMKRIPEELIRSALGTIDDTEYLDLLKSIIEKQRKSIKAKNEYDLKGKILRHCLSKGFESHMVYDLLIVEE
jgi:regulatory protein